MSFYPHLSQTHLEYDPAMKNLGDAAVRGYIRLAEGEKDPRNLMIAFSVLRVLLIEFDVTASVEVSAFCHCGLSSSLTCGF